MVKKNGGTEAKLKSKIKETTDMVTNFEVEFNNDKHRLETLEKTDGELRAYVESKEESDAKI